MISVGFTRAFVRKYNSLGEELRAEVREKLELFRDYQNHKQLKVHKLHGCLSGNFSFSVNYRTRVVFEYVGKNKIMCKDVGDHEIYI